MNGSILLDEGEITAIICRNHVIGNSVDECYLILLFDIYFEEVVFSEDEFEVGRCEYLWGCLDEGVLALH